jgi:hypothetical protein
MWYIIIFVIDLLVAFSWARCVKAVAENNPLSAAIYSGIIALSGAITIISYTKNNWLLIPAVLGSAVGVYVSIWCKK